MMAWRAWIFLLWWIMGRVWEYGEIEGVGAYGDIEGVGAYGGRDGIVGDAE